MYVKEKQDLIEGLYGYITNDKTYAIELDGKRLKMPSGKKAWGKLGAAKNAIRYPLRGNRNHYLLWLKELEEEGRLKYIEI